MIRTFRENFGLKITITTNLKTVNFLDVTFNLCTGKYQPYKKPNDTPTYINVNSKHPPNIIKALPNNISKRISNISSDKGKIIRFNTPYSENVETNIGKTFLKLIDKHFPKTQELYLYRDGFFCLKPCCLLF